MIKLCVCNACRWNFLFSRDEHCLAPGAGMVLSLPRVVPFWHFKMRDTHAWAHAPWPCGMPWASSYVSVGKQVV